MPAPGAWGRTPRQAGGCRRPAPEGEHRAKPPDGGARRL